MTIYERIKDLCTKKKLTITTLEKQCELSQNSIKKWGVVSPKADSLNRVASSLNVSVDYLLGRTENKDNSSMDKFPSEEILYLPVYATVAAGFNKNIEARNFDGDIQEIPISIVRGYNKEDLFVFEVSGDSMYPKFIEGDRVLVVRQSSVDSGDTAIVCYNGDEDGTIKKVMYEPGCDYVDLIPINSAYNPVRIQGESLEDCRIIGKVIYLFRKI